ncbi:MAG: lipocalin family protein [Chitinophagaceae bacterium]
MKKIIFLACITTLFITACKKDDVCNINAASISGAYKITAVTYKANSSSAEIDYFNTLFPDPCDRDNVYTFQTNGTYQIKDAGVICSPNGDDNGTWSFVSENSLTIDGDPVILEKFDCKTLVVVNTDIQTAGDRLKLTLTKQ